MDAKQVAERLVSPSPERNHCGFSDRLAGPISYANCAGPISYATDVSPIQASVSTLENHSQTQLNRGLLRNTSSGPSPSQLRHPNLFETQPAQACNLRHAETQCLI